MGQLHLFQESIHMVWPITLGGGLREGGRGSLGGFVVGAVVQPSLGCGWVALSHD